MAERHDEGWWAERDPEATDLFPWVPTLQANDGCFSLPLWFKTQDDCERFIRDHILGQGVLS